MNMTDHELISLACQARENAYIPYSHYAVGAAIIGEFGAVYTGCNIENASYPAGCCAERVAIFKAISAGERRITALALAAAPEAEKPPFQSYPAPCGICLQVVSEFAAPTLRVLLAKSTEDYRALSMQELLPNQFSAADLKG